MREISFDTETTGLDPNSGHRVVEIGCVELIDRRITGKNFHAYINPMRDMPAAAEAVHGLSQKFLSDKPVFADIAQNFLDFVRDDKLVIHNAGFDMKFINHELEQCKKPTIPFKQAIDTLEMTRKKFPGAKATLDALCGRYGIDLSRRDKHGALLDAELLADVYIELLGGKQGAMQLDPSKASRSKAASPATLSSKKVRQKREFPVSEDELKAHADFLQKIKDPIWEQ